MVTVLAAVPPLLSQTPFSPLPPAVIVFVRMAPSVVISKPDSSVVVKRVQAFHGHFLRGKSAIIVKVDCQTK